MGVQLLYQDTKDISQLMADQARRNTTEEKRKRDLFEPSMNKAKEQKQVRKELEKAYEREKSKVSGNSV